MEARPEPRFKIGTRVKLKPDAEYCHQIREWTTEYAVITDMYLDTDRGGAKGIWWYDIECEDGMYSNDYPEKDIMLRKLDTNKDARTLLTKEW